MPRPRRRQQGKGRVRPPRPPTRRPALVVGLLLVLALLALADRQGWLLAAPPDGRVYQDRRTRVERVVDGDTLIVPLPDAREGTAGTRVRLWGVDAPELARPFDTPPQPAEPLAEEAKALLQRLVADQEVHLVLEPGRTRGHYGRLLAHIVLPDGRLVAEALVEAGLARADSRWPHRFLERLEQLQTRAQRDRVGIWAD